MNKSFLVEQLVQQLRRSAEVARKAGEEAMEEARDGASAAEKRENARVSQENSSLAKGQLLRAHRALDDVAAIEQFRPGSMPRQGPVGMGAIVEVEDEGEGRTFFLAPVGAGVELTG